MTKDNAMRAMLCAAFAIAWLAPTTAQAQYTNADRYGVIQGALATAAPAGGAAGGLAGVAFSTPISPIGLQRFDTPDNRSFGPEGATNFPYGPTLAGLGNPAAAWGMGAPCLATNGRSYGTKTDLAAYWWATAAAPPFPACATNMHLMYNALLGAIRTCGAQCYVDIASLEDINGVESELRGAIETWLQGKPANARLILRITEGYVASRNSRMQTDVDFFARAVRAGQGRVEVYGIAIGSGAPAFGTWSHAKMFGVFDFSSRSYRALIGGQNHWTAYQTSTPPFDTNTMITGVAAAAPSLQLDGAAQWFDAGRSTLGRAVWYGSDAKVHDTGFKWATPGYANASFSRFSGFTNVNPRTVGGPGPAQRAIVSLVDMGRYSTGHLGRTIARTLHDLVAAEPKDNDIRVFNQAICRAGDHWVDGNCAGRSEQTYIGRLVYRALTAARLGWATNVWVMTSSSRPQNDGYPSPYSFNVRSMLYETALAQVCTEEDDYWSFQPGWDQLKFFNNPRGRGDCWAAVVRAINGRFHYRTVTAFMNGTTGRQWAGVHHKLVMFGREAMFQGSFNAYPSEVSSDVSTTYDSKLVENGAIILDPDYVNDQVSAFDEAWATASPIIGGE